MIPLNATKTKVCSTYTVSIAFPLKCLVPSGSAQVCEFHCFSGAATGINRRARLAVQRLRTLQQKKEAQAKSSRRDIATLLERRKIETARIKVEGCKWCQTYCSLVHWLKSSNQRRHPCWTVGASWALLWALTSKIWPPRPKVQKPCFSWPYS